MSPNSQTFFHFYTKLTSFPYTSANFCKLCRYNANYCAWKNLEVRKTVRIFVPRNIIITNYIVTNMKKLLFMFLAACCWCTFAGEFDFTIAKGLKGWQPNTGKSVFDAANKVSVELRRERVGFPEANEMSFRGFRASPRPTKSCKTF